MNLQEFSCGYPGIRSAYEYALIEDGSSDPREMKKIWERILRDFSEVSNEENSDTRYFIAKTYYSYAENLYKLKDFEESSDFFNKAYWLYIQNRNYFETYSGEHSSENLIKGDFVFDSSMANQSLFKSSLSYLEILSSIRNSERKTYGLQNVKGRFLEVLEKQSDKNPDFRSDVWLFLGDVNRLLGRTEDEINCYVYSFLNYQDNSTQNILDDATAVELLVTKGLIDDKQTWQISLEQREAIFQQSPVSVYPEEIAVGGDEPVLSDEEFNSTNAEGEFVNPFSKVSFPRPTCGDPKPVAADKYPWVMVPIYLILTKEDVPQVRSRFCGDAFYTSKESKVQVATFSNFSSAHYFHLFLASKFGEEQVETGAKHVYCSLNSQEPKVIGDNPVEQAC